MLQVEGVRGWEGHHLDLLQDGGRGLEAVPRWRGHYGGGGGLLLLVVVVGCYHGGGRLGGMLDLEG